jgi:hypothetical protein
MLGRGSDATSTKTQDTRRLTITRTTGGPPAFSLETFASKDFIVRDFVENLSESAIPASRRSAPASAQTAFDPKPLIRTFEAALSRLGSLSEDLTQQETELSGSVRRAETQHNQNVASLSQKLEQAIEQFNRLDSTLNGGSNGADVDAGGAVALRIGERLEELERQRQRAQDAKFLIGCWAEVSAKGSLSQLEDMRRLGGGDGKVRCASIARQLLKISERLDPAPGPQINGSRKTNGLNGASNTNGKVRLSSSGSVTRVAIERFLESLEQDLLDQFDEHYRRQNFGGMRVGLFGLEKFYKFILIMLVGMCYCFTRLPQRERCNQFVCQPAPILHRPKSASNG